jgi:NAD(P)-dependent dehydrogenase (short-subunit alcohol dehydrogenase family)
MLFNNAGIPGELGNSWEISPQSIERVFQTNTISHCWTLRAFLPSMIERRQGHIIETCSILGFTWGRVGSPYIASKHALKGYIEGKVRKMLLHLLFQVI